MICCFYLLYCPNKSKNHLSTFVYYLLFVKWNFVFKLRNSGPAKTGPTGSSATALPIHVFFERLHEFYTPSSLGARSISVDRLAGRKKLVVFKFKNSLVGQVSIPFRYFEYSIASIVPMAGYLCLDFIKGCSQGAFLGNHAFSSYY